MNIERTNFRFRIEYWSKEIKSLILLQNIYSNQLHDLIERN